MTEFRIETDSLGEAEGPVDRLRSTQTQRSLQHVSIGPGLIPSEMKVLPSIVVVGDDAAGL
jgi:fumarate hydratase class II